MTKPSFARLLSANIVSSVAGTAIQVATAPVFLYMLTIKQYALILLAQTSAAYVIFFLNGFFYYLMNRITEDAINNRHEHASEIYTFGYLSILALCVTAIVGLGVTVACVGNLENPISLIWIATLGSVMSLAYILVDANYRVRSEYTLGINLLTAARILDFTILTASLWLTRDIFLSLLFSALARIATILILKTMAESRRNAIVLGPNMPSFETMTVCVASAKGQFSLSSYTALSAMGPQLVVSSLFPDAIAVAFNIHRTYMRVVGVLVSIVSASSWPIVNGLYAGGDSHELANFLKNLIVRSLLVSTLVSVTLVLIAPQVFDIFFQAKLTANTEYLILLGFACIFNGGTTIAQTLYLATNLGSKFVLIAILVTATELLLMAGFGLRFGLLRGLFIYAVGEFVIFIVAVIGCAKAVRSHQRIRV